MSGFMIMWLNKDEDNPHSQVGKKPSVACALQAKLSLEPSSASNNNAEGLGLQQIRYGHAALKYIRIYLYQSVHFFLSLHLHEVITPF